MGSHPKVQKVPLASPHRAAQRRQPVCLENGPDEERQEANEEGQEGKARKERRLEVQARSVLAAKGGHALVLRVACRSEAHSVRVPLHASPSLVPNGVAASSRGATEWRV